MSDQQLDPQDLQQEENALIALRKEKLAAERAKGNAFPNDFRRDSYCADLQKKYAEATKEELAEAAIPVKVAGRIMLNRGSFMVIQDMTGRIQVYVNRKTLPEETLAEVKTWDLGDIIAAEGTLARSGKGDLYVEMTHVRLLTKSLRPLPDKHHGLTDTEQRYRQRYVDLIINPEVREVFRVRAGAVSALRKYLDELGFLEVETPILQPLYGGAAARPFITHHNELDQDLYLRISFELYLKRLIVGGLDRVYEIGRDFRNEGVSYKHNPEFTQLEFYLAYADYRDIMAITEQMISYVAQEVLGTQILHFDGHEIDLTPPWKRLEIRQGLLEQSGIDISQYKTAAELSAVLREKGIPHNPNAPRGKMIGDMMEQFLEPILIHSTFFYFYPRDISPLAKNKPGDPQTTERFEGFIAGMELCNAFTELNDPLEQEKRFLELGRAYAEGDEERHPLDEDYLRALAYGMPPTGGFGMGIDRFIMLLTGHHNIREVILFPPMRDTSQA